MPVCGRASTVFSTFTDNAGRPWLAPVGSGRPVSGAVGGATVVVVAAAVVVVALGVAAFESPPPHAARTIAAATANARTDVRPRCNPFTVLLRFPADRRATD